MPTTNPPLPIHTPVLVPQVGRPGPELEWAESKPTYINPYTHKVSEVGPSDPEYVRDPRPARLT